MFDHVGFGVSDYAASKAFFLAALRPLGAAIVMEGPHGIGLGINGKPALWMFQSSDKPAHLHVAFVAVNRKQVDEFYRAAIQAGAKTTVLLDCGRSTTKTITGRSLSVRTDTISKRSAINRRPKPSVEGTRVRSVAVSSAVYRRCA